MTSLRVLLTLIVIVTIVKFVGGILAGSLALLADAGHGLTLGVSLGLALMATRSDASPSTATVDAPSGISGPKSWLPWPMPWFCG